MFVHEREKNNTSTSIARKTDEFFSWEYRSIVANPGEYKNVLDTKPFVSVRVLSSVLSRISAG